jgi:hypothetical protein
MIERFSSSYSNFKLKNECVQTLARLITLNNVFFICVGWNVVDHGNSFGRAAQN